MKITVERLQEILIAHSQWLNGTGGSRAVLRGAVLRGADLRGAVLRGADWRGADLRGAVLRGADLSRADWRGADWRGADLSDADLRDADFRGAILRDAVLRGADLSDADFRGAILRDAVLSDADGKEIRITKAPIQIENLPWFVTIWEAHMQIGCEFHSHTEWSRFCDADIKCMDNRALDLWREWKDILMAMCVKHGGGK